MTDPTRAPGSAVAPYLWFGLFAALLTGYRLWIIGASEFPLFFDEAYYLDWSRDLDWGYYSKPPAVAVLLKITTTLFGETPLGVKSGATLVYSLTAVVVAMIGHRLFDARTGALSGAVFLTLPIVGGNSLFATTDVPLLFFWALTIWAFLRALAVNTWSWWLATGLFLGLGMLSKYTMVLLVPGLMLYLWFSEHRRLLWSGRLWSAFLLGFLVFLPNILWNAGNGFASFRHTAEISQLDRELFHPEEGLAFFAGQLGVLGPLLFPWFLFFVGRRDTYGVPATRVLALTALPILVTVTVLAFLSRAHYNWASPAYVSGTVLTAALLIKTGRLRWLGAAMAVNLLLLSVLYHYHAVLDLIGVQATAKIDPYRRVLGWREAGEGVRPWLDAYPDARVASDSRKVLAYLSYYAQAHRHGLASWNPDGGVDHHYDLTVDLAEFAQSAFVFVSDDPLPDTLLSRFAEVTPLGRVEVTPYPDYSISLHGAYLRGFRGYPGNLTSRPAAGG
ncbi:MAG: glycosyltransferase family 39 protein [Pseudomonadota bacterium]